MSTQTQSGELDYEQGFLEQNSWLRPVGVFVGLCFVLIALIIGSNATLGWLGGTFGQVLFGMIASLIFISVLFTVVLLAVNGTRYLLND